MIMNITVSTCLIILISSIYYVIGCKQREKIMKLIEELKKECKS